MSWAICERCLHSMQNHYKKGHTQYCAVCDGHGKHCLIEMQEKPGGDINDE